MGPVLAATQSTHVRICTSREHLRPRPYIKKEYDICPLRHIRYTQVDGCPTAQFTDVMNIMIGLSSNHLERKAPKRVSKNLYATHDEKTKVVDLLFCDEAAFEHIRINFDAMDE